MKKKLLIGCLSIPVIFVLVLVIGYATLDSEFEVASTITIDAGVDEIYPLVNSLPRWQDWTVWTTEKYPSMVTTYSGPEAGVGAQSSWTEEQGDGSMEITQSNAQTGIDFKLSFAEFPESLGHVHFKAVDGGTEVSMGLKGEMPGMYKLLLPVMKGAMIEEYAQNLEKLKAVVEAK